MAVRTSTRTKIVYCSYSFYSQLLTILTWCIVNLPSSLDCLLLNNFIVCHVCSLPAYNDNSFNVIVFIGFVCVCLYLFVNIALAAVMGEYPEHLKVEAKQLYKQRCNSLEEAFVILTKGQETQGAISISKKMFCPVLQEMKGNYSWTKDEDKLKMLLFVLSDGTEFIGEVKRIYCCYCTLLLLIALCMFHRPTVILSHLAAPSPSGPWNKTGILCETFQQSVYSLTISKLIIGFVERHKSVLLWLWTVCKLIMRLLSVCTEHFQLLSAWPLWLMLSFLECTLTMKLKRLEKGFSFCYST